MKYLFIAEKPSLMKDVEKCYKNHKAEVDAKLGGSIDFIALAGHLCADSEPDEYDMWHGKKWHEVNYPMIPDQWKIKAINDNRKKEILSSIKSNESKYDAFICGTDSDQEGYGIYHKITSYLGLADKPALRFMEHSLTDSEILKSLLSMTDYHKDPVHVRFVQSYNIRAHADWLYGMNGTRLSSLKASNGEVLKVGRVKAPTIKLIYDNSLSIENFKAQKYYIHEADYGSFKAVSGNEKGEPIKYDNESDVPIVDSVGQVIAKQTKRKQTHAPQLFDLTSAQAEAGQQFGYKPDKTLEIIQSLYEKHKVLSYPRTQCRYVSSEKAKEFSDMLEIMDAFDDLGRISGKFTKEEITAVNKDTKVVNDKEVEKESHDALLPTGKRPELTAMTEEEINVCHMIYARFVMQFMHQFTEDVTNIVIRHDDKNFFAKGSIIVDKGWRELHKDKAEAVIPNVNQGDNITANKIGPSERTTKAPKRLNEASLINAMQNIASLIEDKELKKALSESQGIGTPATRASIIKDIITSGYAVSKKEGLYISDLGKTYVNAISELDILNPVFAATQDTKIKKVQRGEADYKEIYDSILTDLTAMCEKLKKGMGLGVSIDEVCPYCNESLTTDRYYYRCSPECGFKIPKAVCGHELNKNTLKLLLKGETSDEADFKSKEGKKFKAKLRINDERKLEFVFPEVKTGTCPFCHSEVQLRLPGAFCDCGLKIFRNIASHKISDEQILQLLKEGKTEKIKGFKSKTGSSFSAELKLNSEKMAVFNF